MDALLVHAPLYPNPHSQANDELTAEVCLATTDDHSWYSMMLAQPASTYENRKTATSSTALKAHCECRPFASVMTHLRLDMGPQEDETSDSCGTSICC